jgi:putative salt-induced outer membrane protein YdiY
MGLRFFLFRCCYSQQVRFPTALSWFLMAALLLPGVALGQSEETEAATPADQSAEPSESTDATAASGEDSEPATAGDKATPAATSEEGVAPPKTDAGEGAAAGELAPVPGLPADSASWMLPSNDTAKWDWVLMKSGEWIKGSIDRMRDGDMEFDSDEFDNQVLDMDDVAGFYANRIHTYLLEDGSTISGKAVLRGEELVVDGKKIDRALLLGIIKGKEKERNYWSGKLNLGLALMLGNTEQATFTSSGYIRRESAKSRLSFDHNMTFGRVSKETNVQNLTGTIQFDIYLSKRWYFTPVWGIATHDRFQNIDIRVIPGAGAGVHLFKTSVFSWDIDLGLGYQYQDYREVLPGEDNPLHDGVVRLSTWMEVDVGKLVDLELTWWTVFVYTNWDTTSHHGSLTFEVELTDIFDLTISAIYDRIEQPASYIVDDTTTPPTTATPKSDDLQLTVGVMVEF